MRIKIQFLIFNNLQQGSFLFKTYLVYQEDGKQSNEKVLIQYTLNKFDGLSQAHSCKNFSLIARALSDKI